jgi:hypothetical protein
VLPFVDQSAEAVNSYFSDGLVEDIISALSCLPELVVISRTSMLRYRGRVQDPRQIRRDLHVRYMLSGSVRRAGDKVRLSAELADCESGTAIWSDRFAGDQVQQRETVGLVRVGVLHAGRPTANVDRDPPFVRNRFQPLEGRAQQVPQLGLAR